MPRQKPGRSAQDLGTPDDFIRAVESRWGAIDIDLAARADNAVCVDFISPEEDSLAVDWLPRLVGLNCWLNPEFGNIEPFVEKCARVGPHLKGGRIIVLTPASVDSRWFFRHVKEKAMVIALRQRMVFKGAPINPKTGKPDGFPKGLMLSVFAPGMVGFTTWGWKEEQNAERRKD